MPTRPERGCGVLPVLALAFLVGGCAATTPRTDPEVPEASPILHELAAALPGEYSTFLGDGTDRRRLLLAIHTDPSVAADRLRLILVQSREGQSDAVRQFAWTLIDDQQGLRSEFAPLDPSGQVQRRCAMSLAVQRNGLTAQTNPGDCRFGEGEQMTGLLKEIAFDGSQLVIADRLVSLPDGEPTGTDQVTQFFPIRDFSGWAGVHDGAGWRISNTLQLHTAAGLIEPRDAAGMSLELLIELSHYQMRRGEQVMLRLTVTDADSGQLLGEAWADADARSIGLALPDIQVGLEADL